MQTPKEKIQDGKKALANPLRANNLKARTKEIEEVCINLLLTRECNYECAHCMYASGPKMPKDQLRWEDLSEIREFVQSLANALSPNTNFKINLVGGEPTLDIEHFQKVLQIVSGWEHPNDGGIEIETTTNGHWLETPEKTAEFSRSVRWLLAEERLTIRISNSLYHQPFRSESLKQRFKRNTHKTQYGGVITSLDNILSDMLEELIEENWTSWEIEALREYAQENLIYIANFVAEENKVSPVGRARLNELGWQDGSCSATGDVKFTFQPTKEGQRPGRIYDACCNGGKIELGFADEGIKLLHRRIHYMDALHQAYPISTNSPKENPGCGERCRNCASFAAKWVKENKMSPAPK